MGNASIDILCPLSEMDKDPAAELWIEKSANNVKCTLS